MCVERSISYVFKTIRQIYKPELGAYHNFNYLIVFEITIGIQYFSSFPHCDEIKNKTGDFFAADNVIQTKCCISIVIFFLNIISSRSLKSNPNRINL